MYDPDLSKVRFTGPLAVFAPDWRAVLVAEGYVSCSAAIKLQLVAHLSRWLQARGLGAGELTEPVIMYFLAERRATYTAQVSLEALAPFLDYLRSRDAIPGRESRVPVTAQEILLAEYQDYLLIRRGLSAPVIIAYGHWIMPFLDHLQSVGCRAEDDELTGDIVASYLTTRLAGLSRKSAKMTTSVLRSFLGFIHAAGYSTASLTAAVPPIVSWQLSGMPQPLSGDETAALLAAADRNTTAGNGTMRWCCCCFGWRFAAKRSRSCGLRMWTGHRVPWSFMARAGGLTLCRCLWMSGPHWPTTSGTPVRAGFRHGRYLSGSRRRSGGLPPQASHTLLRAWPKKPGSVLSMATGSATLQHPMCSMPEPLWKRSRSSCVMPAPRPP